MVTITTPTEVLDNSPAGRDYPTTHICDVLPTIEETLWNRCFGETFYEYMIAHRNDLPEYEDWDDCKVYSEGDFVQRDTCIFESLVNLNRSDPLENSTKWERFKKFDSDCLNKIGRAHV